MPRLWINALRRHFRRHWLCAVRAATSIDRNLTQALGALLGSRVRRRRRFPHPAYEGIDRRHYEKIYGSSDQQERNGGVNEIADQELAPTNGEAER